MILNELQNNIRSQVDSSKVSQFYGGLESSGFATDTAVSASLSPTTIIVRESLGRWTNKIINNTVRCIYGLKRKLLQFYFRLARWAVFYDTIFLIFKTQKSFWFLLPWITHSHSVYVTSTNAARKRLLTDIYYRWKVVVSYQRYRCNDGGAIVVMIISIMIFIIIV